MDSIIKNVDSVNSNNERVQPEEREGLPQMKPTKSKDTKSVINLNKYLNKYIRVKFNGGREVRGILKGFDVMSNLVLDEVEEFKCESEPFYSFEGETRSLGLVVARGTSVTLIFSDDGTAEIENPFIENSTD